MRMKAEKVRAMNIKEVVDNDEWQIVRKSLIGNWKNNHLKNVHTLREYFNSNYNDPLAIRRLVNVLTGSVHRVGHTFNQKETDIIRFDVRVRWAEMLGLPTSDIKGRI